MRFTEREIQDTMKRNKISKKEALKLLYGFYKASGVIFILCFIALIIMAYVSYRAGSL
jgi:uncharacterized membrane protein